MAELVDALASGASVLRDVEVQVLSRVPSKEDLPRSFLFATLPGMPHIHTGAGQHDTTVSAFIIRMVDEQPKILLHMHKKFNKLLQPGGHVELHENPWQAIAHELLEETGYRLDQLDVLQPVGMLTELPGETIHPIPCIVNTHEIDNGGVPHHHTDSAYAFVTTSEPLRVPASGESTDLRWLSLADIDALPRSSLYDDTRILCRHIVTVTLRDWQPLPVTAFHA